MAQTEEEQIAQFKSWWKENGNSLLIGILLALALTGGWRYWQHHQANQKEQAALIFNNVLKSMSANTDNAAIVEQLNSLKQEYGSLGYAQYGSLLLAKIAVNENKPNEAVDLLQTLIANTKDQQIRELAITRLVSVLLDLKRYDDALQILAQETTIKAYQAHRFELKGDVLAAQGEIAAAKQAYLESKKLAADVNNEVISLFLQEKIDDLASVDS